MYIYSIIVYYSVLLYRIMLYLCSILMILRIINDIMNHITVYL